MLTDYNTFFNIKIPSKGYHCYDGVSQLVDDDRLTINCQCGQIHAARECYAFICFPLEGKTLYLCPSQPGLFILVRPKGFFSVKGLKIVSAFQAMNPSEVTEILRNLELRKKRE